MKTERLLLGMTSSVDASDSPVMALHEHLQNFTEALAAAGTQAEVLDVVLKPALQALGALAGGVLLVDENTQTLCMAAHQGYAQGVQTIWQDGPLSAQVPAADVLRTHEPLYFEHAGALVAVYPELEAQTGALASVATTVLPMFLDGRPLGTLVLDFKEPHTFTPQERRFLRTLASQCAVALGRAKGLRQLEGHLAERTRKMGEDAQAHEAFVTFTEAVGSETDLPALVRQAITVLQGRFPGSTVAYYELDGGLWKGRVWSDDISPDLAQVILAGLSTEAPLFDRAVKTRQPVFIDAWDAQREQVESSEEYEAAAGYPLVLSGDVHSLLTVGLRDTSKWLGADQGLGRSVGA